MMPGIIVVLEDSEERIGAMGDRLKSSFSEWSYIFFNNAPDAIAWLKGRLQDCVLISLDRDLGPSWNRDGQLFDPGVGRDVVDYLITQPPQCPVIIHSSNSDAAVGMEMALAEHNWSVERVIPFQHLDSSNSAEWIDRDWAEAIARLLAESRERPSRPKPEAQEIPRARMIIVLEDSKLCWDLTRRQLEEVLPARPSVRFNNASELMAWLERHLEFPWLERNRKIVILDNSLRRIELMRRKLDELFPERSAIFFDNAPEAIAWLEENLEECDLISTDYNLGPSWTRKGERFDPGTGRDLVDYLATKPPQCPIIFHSSRSEADVGMEIGLLESTWIFERVVHSNDLRWIETSWLDTVNLLLKPIANAELTSDRIPQPDAKWEGISQFALSFNGYQYWGNVRECIEVGDRCAEAYLAEGILPSDLAELRAGLLVERNRWRRYGAEPSEEAMAYMRAIVEGIRQWVKRSPS